MLAVNGYYTINAEGDSLAPHRRIALEILFAKEFESALGGADQAKQLCLLAARGDAAAAAIVAQVRGRIEQSLLSAASTKLAYGFAIQVWEAIEL